MEDRGAYIELTNDLLFHMVFTKNEKALRDLLEALLGLSPADIKQIEILNPMQYNNSIQTKLTILDLKIHLNGESYILVEMQVRDFDLWTNRALIYACRQIDEQTNGKEAYEDLQPVVQISIMKHSLFPEHRQFYTEYKIQDDEHQMLTDKLRFFVLDLSAVDRASETEKQQGLVQWAQAFNASDWNTVESIDRPGIREAKDTMAMIMTNPTQRQLLLDRQMAIMDYNTQIISAEKKGQMKGEEIGLIKGEEIGLIKGEEIGLIKGEKIGQIKGEKIATQKLARGMTERGIAPQVIAEITGLTLDEIARL